MKNSRRDFLKKVAYSAPVVASLGMLVEPTGADAYEGSFGKKNQKSKVKKNHAKMTRKPGDDVK